MNINNLFFTNMIGNGIIYNIKFQHINKIYTIGRFIPSCFILLEK